MRTYGGRSPLFCMHPLGGLSWPYSGLMKHIPAEYPVYGLQARGMSGPARLPGNLREMAADYIDEIRRIQPKGPFYLLGWSFGGHVAHAVATQLQQQGEEIALLAILDAVPRIAGSQVLNFPEMQEILAGLVKDLGRDPGEGPLDFSTVKEFLQRDGEALSMLDEHHFRAMYDVARNNHLLVSNFVPDPFDGDLFLCTATLDRTGEEPPPEAWQPFISGAIKVHSIPCRHQLMMEPASLARIGSLIAAELEEIATRFTRGRTHYDQPV